MVRLFLAISLPEKIKARLAALQQELAQSGADVRWVRPEGIHLTLKFFGNVPEELIDQLAQAAREVVKREKIRHLRLNLKGLGTFPPKGKPRVVWVGLEGDLADLARLQHSLEKVFAKFGFEPEKRAFVPHITLGRVKSSRKIDRLLKALSAQREKDFGPGEIEINELVLYQSTLKPTGAIYTPLRRIPLEP